MLIIRIFRFILGFIDIEITGDFAERLLNLFSINKISVWNIDKNDNKLYATIKVKDFKKTRKIRGKTGIKIKIIKRHGLPFIFYKNRRRYGFVCGIVLFFAILYGLSLFVWQVQVVGNSNVDSSDIISACEEIGLKKGMLKRKINSYYLRDVLLLKCNSLSWASVNVEGCVVTVNVSEIKNQNNDTDFCNIVSEHNAIIKNIVVYKGSSQVKVGEAVSKGDLLISGVVESAGHTYFTAATGVITAEIEEKIEINTELTGINKNYINKGYSKYAINFFGVKIPAFLGGETRNYDYVSEYNTLNLFGKDMPITLYKLSVYPYVISNYSKSVEEIEEEIKEKFNKFIKDKNIDNVNVINVDTVQTETNYKAVYTVKYQKNIGVKEKILF